PSADRSDPPMDAQPRPLHRRLLWAVLIALAVNVFVLPQLLGEDRPPEIPYSVFRAEAEADNVQSVLAKGDSLEGRFRTAVRYTADGGDTADAGDEVLEFRTERPPFADDGLVQLLVGHGVTVEAERVDATGGWLVTVLLNFGPLLLLVGAYMWLMRRAGSGLGSMGGIGSIGRSTAVQAAPGETRTTFADVAGIDEAKDELVEVVEFLRSPERYRAVGARAPRGVLLMGPPGTGKTLLARAVAGEANVPFFSMSASEFIEMIVGVGASRVRDLFDRAKKVAPSIVFIDELDAIGRARGSVASFGGVDEREQTLNQILTEMDGFTGNEGVIVLAATNRPDVLDPALLRPGRFDRRVTLNPPDQAGRAAILGVHTRDVPLAPDADVQAIASTTTGMVGADLANLVNEAALMAARRDRQTVTARDFSDALERIVLGAERKIMLSEDDRRRTAYHESGHALLGMLLPGADPVRKISIIPRGRTLGVTFQSPAGDRYGMSETELRDRVTGALGGRAAEELVFGDLTTGAENDLEQVTEIARQMVGRWGMSRRVGPMSVLPEAGADIGLGAMDPRSPSEATRRLVDAEARAVIDQCHERAIGLLREHREQLDRLATTLLARETLGEAEAYAVAGVPER
ncbi:MAG: ATP-dependent metalloprotease FtsH, partial [Actinomycetota bacterium]